MQAGSAKLSTTTAQEQNQTLGPQVYGRNPDPGKHRKIISTIAFRGKRKNNKLNFLWPKMARLGPRFQPQNPHEKVYVGPFFVSFPTKWGTLTFFWGPKIWDLAWGANVCVCVCVYVCVCWKSLCAFLSLSLHGIGKIGPHGGGRWFYLTKQVVEIAGPGRPLSTDRRGLFCLSGGSPATAAHKVWIQGQ